MSIRNSTLGVAAAALLAGALPALAEPPVGQVDGRSPKQLNDPLPPAAMQTAPPGVVPTPRGTPEGMGNEVDLTKTPGDDDPSDGIDEPGRDPVPGDPRPAPGVEKR